ncbi:MAG: four helix bundle protein [Omnitrophica WOR_2 bacterium GWF2_43_52]|nr:MAG: four helix bundle protein [Omnitrophica WOR_2 bacterium GWA2_44_7]OGX20288.1 MAG: four helix bundle protein [Omnitrophica WOR_2 bacterium GWF2_43_52]OGX56389.1 MAG: four helix bundle protein [Omnitrophica WOR_2 bacterium RIFOXYC2_FULL_43_9]HAH21283.1 four helix bundle protein [Candidatus Omnitrophota bacterium]HBG63905.1 four helix bundle protein [Candidatus Omnitrophota bacterium]
MAKKYDLEERTEQFAKDVIQLCKKLSKNTINIELMSQAIRAAGSVGANYIEANESLSKKDFFHRIKICRKEAKESRYWHRLILSANPEIETEARPLMQEATELMNIFGAILRKGA